MLEGISTTFDKSSPRSLSMSYLWRLVHYFKDPLRKNSMFLIEANVLSALLGFLFWMVAARLYPTEAVGLATATISAARLLEALSSLGLGIGIIRFLPDEKDKRGLINSCYTIAGLFSLMLAIIFIAGLNLWSPAFTSTSPKSSLVSGIRLPCRCFEPLCPTGPRIHCFPDH